MDNVFIRNMQLVAKVLSELHGEEITVLVAATKTYRVKVVFEPNMRNSEIQHILNELATKYHTKTPSQKTDIKP